MIITASIYGNVITLPRIDTPQYNYEVYGLPDGSLQLVAEEENQTIPSDWKRYEVDYISYDHTGIYLKTGEIPHGIYEIIGYGEKSKSMNLRKIS